MTCPIFTGSGESLPPLPRGAPHTRCAVEPSAGPPVAGHGHERGTPRRRNAGSHPPNGPGCEDSYIRPPFLPPPSLLPPLPPPPLPPAALVQVCRSHPYATSTCTRPRCPPATPAGRGERAACHPAAPCTGPQGPLRIGVALRGEPPKKGACRGGGGGWGTPKERPFAQPSHRTCWHSNKRVHGDPTQQQSSGTAMQCILDIPAARGEEERGGGGLALVSSPHVGTDTEADAGTSAVPSCGWVRRGFHCGRVERVQQQPKTLVCCSTLVLLAGPPGGGPGGVADPVGAPSPALLHRTCQWRTHSRRPAVGWFWKILPH